MNRQKTSHPAATGGCIEFSLTTLTTPTGRGAHRRGTVPGDLGQASRGAGLDVGGPVRPAPTTGAAAPELQPLIPIRLHWPDLAPAGPLGPASNSSARPQRLLHPPARGRCQLVQPPRRESTKRYRGDPNTASLNKLATSEQSHATMAPAFFLGIPPIPRQGLFKNRKPRRACGWLGLLAAILKRLLVQREGAACP